jgi:hypothetical protein
MERGRKACKSQQETGHFYKKYPGSQAVQDLLRTRIRVGCSPEECWDLQKRAIGPSYGSYATSLIVDIISSGKNAPTDFRSQDAF